MRALKKLYTILALGLAMPLTCIGPAGATVFEVRIDTAAGSLGNAVMGFDFNDADASFHQLHIWDFASDGKLDVLATNDPADCPLGVFPFSVDPCRDPANSNVAGSLGKNPPVMISDAPPPPTTPITYYQEIDLNGAKYISFRFEMSGDLTAVAASPDGFAFWLFNPGDVEDADGNPGGDLLLPGPLVLYSFDGACETTSFDGVATTCTEVPSVPEPAPVTLAVAALLALTCARWAAAASHRRGATRV